MFEMFALLINLLILTISDAMVTCYMFSFYLHVWNSLTQRILTTIFYITYSGICRGNLPRKFADAICRRILLWKFAAGTCHDHLPWEFTAGICRGNLPQEFAVGICRRNLPWEFAAGICRENLPSFFCICKQNLFCVREQILFILK